MKWTHGENPKPRKLDTEKTRVYTKPRIVDTDRSLDVSGVPKWEIGMAAPINKFTDEQIEYFKHNRHVRNVGRSFVYFNDDFKEQFWRMYHEENMLAKEILMRLGVDYDMLGRKRLEGIVQNLRKKYANGIAEDKRKKRQTDLMKERQTSKLRAEIEYLRQENEFLKKMVLAGKEGKR